MKTNILHLEGALRRWENYCFHLQTESILSRASGQHPDLVLPEQGPLVNAFNFRKYLLKCHSEEFDYSKYVGVDEVRKAVATAGHFLEFLPCSLTAWTKYSRRVFHLSSDLAHILMATSLSDICWDEVPWPFDSFAITLETPIRDSRGHQLDCILFSRETGIACKEDTMCIRAFAPGYCEIPAISPYVRQRIREAISKRRWGTASELLAKASDQKADTFAAVSYIPYTFGKVTEEQSDGIEYFDKVTNETRIENFDEHAEFEMIKRLVVGLCLYLKTLPSESSHASDWQRVPNPTKDATVITKEALVCSVDFCHKLSTDEKEALRVISSSARSTLVEISAHFRRGHWRRAPGTGDNPSAPKIVQVRPCIVRKDRLPQGSLPKGALSEVC
ncbi:hypothetical protein KGQ27_00755 [Patescibacteria group bacterium]|nr:hypothetical protein [Patescibacteria group bacterium]MDE1946877.1 hypothetical protein [Patescibacteria group bacterium]MDE2010697.1 hypothetical protein [Patescibacteria group bacterium]MDE2232697.1 hypothetical protein [Patescibacteria group bacterium]